MELLTTFNRSLASMYLPTWGANTMAEAERTTA
jgi:hypothetical protein